jgi:hypothetical protein
MSNESGVIGWQQFNEKWDSRTTQWNSPIDWFAYTEQQLHSTNYSILYRYLTMLYYSLINLGLGEIGPINKYEMIFCIVSLVISALMFTNIFSSIASLTAILNYKEIVEQ